MEEKPTYHIFSQDEIQEFKNLLIVIAEELNYTDQTWYTVVEAAEYLRCSSRTIRRGIELGTLRSERLNTGGKRGSLRFHRKWLDAFVLGFNARTLTPMQNRLLRELHGQ